MAKFDDYLDPGIPPGLNDYVIGYAQGGGANSERRWLFSRIAPAFIQFTAKAVNFNAANTDTVIPLQIPGGYTRFRMTLIAISNPSHSLSTATCGLFTAAAGGGIAIVTGGSAITVTATTEETNNNMQVLTVNNINTLSYNIADVPNLYFRVGTAQGAAATADVTIMLWLLP